MNLLKIIDNFYTYTLDGFIKRYKYEQGITGFLGLSFLSNFMSLIRNAIIYSYNFVTTSYPFKLLTYALSEVLEKSISVLSYSFSALSKVFSHSSSKAIEFAEGPLKTFAETKAIPAIKKELDYISHRAVAFGTGVIICTFSVKNLYNLAFNNDTSKKYSYPELGALAFSGAIDCGLVYLSATALMTPTITKGSDYLTTTTTLCFLVNYLLKQSIAANASRS